MDRESLTSTVPERLRLVAASVGGSVVRFLRAGVEAFVYDALIRSPGALAGVPDVAQESFFREQSAAGQQGEVR